MTVSDLDVIPTAEWHVKVKGQTHRILVRYSPSSNLSHRFCLASRSFLSKLLDLLQKNAHTCVVAAFVVLISSIFNWITGRTFQLSKWYDSSMFVSSDLVKEKLVCSPLIWAHFDWGIPHSICCWGRNLSGQGQWLSCSDEHR